MYLFDMGPIKFTAQINSVKTLKDGGGRITLEFGLDGLSEIQRLQRANGHGEMNFMVVCVPIHKSQEVTPDDWTDLENTEF